jgi:hypothetical protein
MNLQENPYLSDFLALCSEDETANLFQLWTGIFTLTAAMGRKTWVDWESQIYPNMYVCLTGDAAVRKSTAVNRAAQLLSQIPSINVAPSAVTAQVFIKILADSLDWVSMPNGSIVPHCSVCAIAGELTTFIRIKDSEHISNLVDLYDCKGDFKYTTFVHGEIAVENVCLSILGGTTPRNLQEHLPPESMGGGFTSRIIFVYGEQPPRLFSDVMTEAKRARHDALINRLVATLKDVHQLAGPFRIEPNVVRLYKQWRVDARENPPTPAYDPQLQHYIGRRESHLRKLMMAISAGRSAELTLREIDFLYAAAILELTEETMPRALRIVGASPRRVVMNDILHRIYSRDQGATFQELLQPHIASISKSEFIELLDQLITCNNVAQVGAHYVVGSDPIKGVLAGRRSQRLNMEDA